MHFSQIHLLIVDSTLEYSFCTGDCSLTETRSIAESWKTTIYFKILQFYIIINTANKNKSKSVNIYQQEADKRFRVSKGSAISTYPVSSTRDSSPLFTQALRFSIKARNTELCIFICIRIDTYFIYHNLRYDNTIRLCCWHT